MANELCETSCPVQAFCNSAEQEAQNLRRLSTSIELMYMEDQDSDDEIEVSSAYEANSVTDLVAKGMVRQWYEELVQESAEKENREALLAMADDDEAIEAYANKYVIDLEERAAASGISMDDLWDTWHSTDKSSLGFHDEELEELVKQVEEAVEKVHEYYNLPLTKAACISGPVPGVDSDGKMVMFCGSPNLTDTQIEKSAQPLE